MFKRALPIAAFGLGILLFSTDVEAADNLKVDIDSEANQIKLDWNDDGNSYSILQEGKKIWEGKESEYIANDLESGTKYNYTLVSYDDNKDITREASVRAQTTKKDLSAARFSTSNVENEQNNVMDNITVNSVQAEDSVKISWDGIVPDEDGTYEVYRDGVYIGTTVSNNYTDSDVVIDQDHKYEIVGKKKLSNEEITEIKEHAKEIGVEDELNDEDFYDIYKIERLVKAEQESPMMRVAAATQNYTMEYTTFIPTRYADNPFDPTGISAFGGDNRGFDMFSNKYRTRSSVNISFGSSTSVSLTKRVAPTYLYARKIQYKPIGVQQASSAGMKISNITRSSSKASYRLYHDVGIPWGDGISPDITYSYNATVYKDGGYSVSGSHDRAPSHEMYIYIPNSGSYNTLHRAKHQEFRYLFPTYANTKFNSSW
ncbi:hypothetical protein [Terribacillus saccharophilus]|uniref:hypothetical protein n=1 Tax=Terribacillus saccharophilus TaxID=361277 RepID=UPI00298A0344|nr:hypothetical protein [Terribacillus saccharophilus]MCM3225968.1 DUF3238 domain-containing protein [Terribacillus saccharophilus]